MTLRLIQSSVWISAFSLFSGLAFAQFNYDVETPPETRAGAEAIVEIVIHVDPPWYVYAPNSGADALGMVETTVAFAATDAIQVASPIYPPTKTRSGYSVFQGRSLVIRQPIRIRPRASPGHHALKGTITYQVCKRDICLPPASDELAIRIVVE